jgi:hypothetical protein
MIDIPVWIGEGPGGGRRVRDTVIREDLECGFSVRITRDGPGYPRQVGVPAPDLRIAPDLQLEGPRPESVSIGPNAAASFSRRRHEWRSFELG